MFAGVMSKEESSTIGWLFSGVWNAAGCRADSLVNTIESSSFPCCGGGSVVTVEIVFMVSSCVVKLLVTIGIVSFIFSCEVELFFTIEIASLSSVFPRGFNYNLTFDIVTSIFVCGL